MELLIVILIVAVAAGYVARTFYLKFLRGKSRNASCGCTGCSCAAQGSCNLDANAGDPPDACPTEENH